MSQGTTADAPASDPPTGRRRRRVLAGLTAATLMATTATVLSVGTAFAAVPTAPDNLLVFPNRDFITIEGFKDHKGEVATIEVARAGKVVGSAQGTVSGDEVAFEVNHPGGVCWGAGTGLAVTPDIVPGDVVSIKFGGAVFGDTTVQSAGFADVGGVPTATSTVNGNVLTVEGVIDPANNPPDPANMEQRIVNPDGFRTSLGKRDIRAVPGAAVTAPKTGTAGTYTSQLTVAQDGKSYKATYTFDDAAVATTAKNGAGERLLQWQTTDAAANRQGVTIAEAGETGGPGFGGCPAGPAQAAPTAGQASVVRSTDKVSAKVTWSAATAQPGAPAVSGYSVEAVNTTAGANGNAVLGSRTLANATTTTITGLDAAASYTYEVRPMTGTTMGAPFAVAGAGGSTTTPGTVTPANLTITPKGGAQATPTPAGSVTATAAAGYQIYYTDDGTLASGIDGPSNSAKVYTGPVAITKATPLSIVAYDVDGNFGQSLDDGWYTPGTDVAPPTGLTATGGAGQVTLKWTASPGVAGYQVNAYQADGTTKLATQPPAAAANATQQLITGLAAGDYRFTLTAKNAGGAASPESTPQASATVTATTDTVTISRPVWKTNDFRVVGSSSAPGGTVSVYAVDPRLPANSTAQPIPGMGNQPLTAAVAPATGSTFDIRLRNTTNIPRPSTIWVKSSNGGVASSAVG